MSDIENQVKGIISEQLGVSIDEVKNLLFTKKIFNGVTIIALQWFFLEFYKD